MKICKSCKKEIEDKANKCPYCQSDQRIWFAKHPLLTIILIIFIFGIIGSQGGNKSSTKTNNNSDVNNIVETIVPTIEQKKEINPKVGDVTNLGDREFTVNSVKRTNTLGYSTPKSGKEFIVVNVTIKNLGTEEVSYNPFDFKVQDANGAQESTTFASLDDNLSSGTLASNGKVSGSMVFEVPKGDEAKLIFQPSFLNSQRIVVELGNK